MYSTSETMLTPEELKKRVRYYLETLVSRPLKTHIYEVTSEGVLIRSYENWDRDAFCKELLQVHNETVQQAVGHIKLKQYIEASRTIGVDVGAILVETLKTLPDTVYAILLGNRWHLEYRDYEGDYADDYSLYKHDADLFPTKEEAQQRIDEYTLKGAIIVPFTFKEKQC